MHTYLAFIIQIHSVLVKSLILIISEFLSALISNRSDFYFIKDTAINGYNNEVISVSSAELCAAECVTRTTFVCRSFEFDLNSRTCYMSEENEKTQSDDVYTHTGVYLFVRISK